MSSNTIFIILTSILIIAVVFYLIGAKKGKPQSTSQFIPAQTPSTTEDDDDEEGL